MTKTVHFHGKLKELCPEPYQVEAQTIRQVLEALKVHPKLDPKLTTTRYEAQVRGLTGVKGLDTDWPEDEVHIEFIRSVGRLSGSGGAFENPRVRLVIAIIIIVIAVAYGQYQVAGGAAEWGLAATMALQFGIALAAGALIELLAPSPDSEDKRSHLANDYKNTVQVGIPIPIILGEHLWGGHYISYNTKPEIEGTGWWSGYGGTGGGYSSGKGINVRRVLV